MKTFFRKLMLSFLAMLCGWIACNIACWAAYAIWSLSSTQAMTDIRVMLAVGVGTGVVIALAWLVVFFPVDLMMADTSKLRKPKNAAATGLIGGFLVSSLYMLWAVAHSGTAWDGSGLFIGLFVSAAALTGCVAALVRALMKPAQSLP